MLATPTVDDVGAHDASISTTIGTRPPLASRAVAVDRVVGVERHPGREFDRDHASRRHRDRLRRDLLVADEHDAHVDVRVARAEVGDGQRPDAAVLGGTGGDPPDRLRGLRPERHRDALAGRAGVGHGAVEDLGVLGDDTADARVDVRRDAQLTEH